jgi:hypothetical protein
MTLVAQKTQKTKKAQGTLKVLGTLRSKFKIFYDICTFVNYTKFGNLCFAT